MKQDRLWHVGCRIKRTINLEARSRPDLVTQVSVSSRGNREWEMRERVMGIKDVRL